MGASGHFGIEAAAKAALTAIILLAGASRAAEDYAQWQYSGDLFLNTTPDGANVAGTVSKFPLLVRLNGATFDFRQARKDGKDIRFASSAGKHLPYQIDRWDSAKAVAEIWVLMDDVKGNRDDQYLRMHWGKANAPDSSKGPSVFASVDDWAGVWHLGPELGTRPNSTTGQPAVPVNYGGDTAVTGLIGLCDNLETPAGQEEYLQFYDDYTYFSSGFTYSVWVYPTRNSNYGRLLDFGNGRGLDNILLNRIGTSEDLTFNAFRGATRIFDVTARGALKVNQWQHFAVTISGLQARLYRNGVLLGEDSLAQALPAVRRAYQYIGKSNWGGQDEYFQGRVDEPALSFRARSADFIKLAYENQRSGSTLVSFQRTLVCVSAYGSPKDTVLSEGRLLELSAQADCATSYTWSGLTTNCPRILDPDVKTLQVYLPRVTKDEILVYRFTARYGDSVRTKDVRVTVRETIPDPIWSFPTLPPWNGKDSLALKPTISNLAAVKASRDSVLRWAWTLKAGVADTAWRKDHLSLRKATGGGPVIVGLCLDNGGPTSCKEISVTVQYVTGVAAPATPEAAARVRAFRDAAGRMRTRPQASGPPASGSPAAIRYPAKAAGLSN